MVGGEQYIHVLKYTLIESEVYDEETGTIIPGATADIEIPCRAKPNTAQKPTTVQDGLQIIYRFDLGFPMGTQQIPVGLEVSIIGVDGDVMYKGGFLKWQKGEYSIRGWV